MKYDKEDLLKEDTDDDFIKSVEEWTPEEILNYNNTIIKLSDMADELANFLEKEYRYGKDI